MPSFEAGSEHWDETNPPAAPEALARIDELDDVTVTVHNSPEPAPTSPAAVARGAERRARTTCNDLTTRYNALQPAQRSYVLHTLFLAVARDELWVTRFELAMAAVQGKLTGGQR